MKLLIDECLHTSLVQLGHASGHITDHINYLGLGSSKDWELMKLILEQDYTFVTNNRTDFLSLYQQAQLHSGLVIIVPNVTPELKRRLFAATLNFIGDREIVNAVIEVDLVQDKIECRQYPLSRE